MLNNFLLQQYCNFVVATKINTNLDTNTMVGGIVDFVCEIAKYMGIVVAVSGAFMLVFAYKDDNAEQQSRAIRFIIVGFVAVGLKTFLKLIGIVS